MNLGWILLISVLTFFSPPARAELTGVRQEIASPDGKLRAETTVFVIESESDRQQAVEFARDSLARDLIENPKLQILLNELIEAERAPSSIKHANDGRKSLRDVGGDRKIKRTFLGSRRLAALKENFAEWYRPHRERITLALTRGLVNGAVMTWSYSASGLPLEVALPVGAFSGFFLSGGFQYFNQAAQTFVMKSFHRHFKNPALKAIDKLVEPFARQFVIEFAYISAIELFLTALGHPPSGGGAEILWHTAAVSLAGFSGQAFLDGANARYTKWKLAEADSPAAQAVIQSRSDKITLVVSALTVAATAAKLSGLPAADTAFLAMSATGVVSYLKILYEEHRCGRLLEKESPPASKKEANAISRPTSHPATSIFRGMPAHAFNPAFPSSFRVPI